MGYIFEWDPDKGESNARKHGVTFDKACTVFGDPLALLMADPDHSVAEERYVLPGMSSRRRLLVVAYAERPPRTRLISARRAPTSERRGPGCQIFKYQVFGPRDEGFEGHL